MLLWSYLTIIYSRRGFVGVHAQTLKLLVLRKVFIEQFDKSPILIEDDFVISLRGIIDATFFNS